MSVERRVLWAQPIGYILCGALTLLASASYAGPSLTRASVPAIAPFACDGPRDLIVERGRIALDGAQAFDHVCVQNGGILDTSGGLVLRAGALYVAADSRIVADGRAGYAYETHDCGNSGATPDGEPGYSLTLVARQAIIQGQVSADGGHGLDNQVNCLGVTRVGSGGDGGTVLVEAQDLRLTGTVSAAGGAGGSAAAAPGVRAARLRSGSGGKGGVITLALPHPDLSALGPLLSVAGGKAGTPGAGPRGAGAAPGAIHIRPLSAAERGSIPPPPVAVVETVGSPPAREPLDPRFAVAHDMRCGAGDFHVHALESVQLAGTHRYRRVCVDGAGTLVAHGSLTLVARTILVAPFGRIAADGADEATMSAGGDGRYEARGACRPDRAAPHPGVPGAPAVDKTEGDAFQPIVLTAAAGAGGGTLTLIARSALLAGTLSVAGGAGEDGAYNENTPNGHRDSDFVTGGGGGSGGSIRVVAADLQLDGQVSVAGGAGGGGAGGVATAGAHGGPGCIKLFAGALHAPGGVLPLVGPAVVGGPLPTDPAPPAPGAQYDAGTGHALAGAFLRFWQDHGGLDVLGGPRTEPFSEAGHLAQYTDRALLMLAGGQVALAPLGRQLTEGRAFPPVSPFAPSPARRYFPATGHSLTGRFLAYWRAHDGQTLLGAPISEVIIEGNGDGSGRRYPLQWFERGRLEYHAEHAGTRYEVQVGLLGVQALRRRRWLP